MSATTITETCTCEIGVDDTILNIDQYCPDHFDGDGAPLTQYEVTVGALLNAEADLNREWEEWKR